MDNLRENALRDNLRENAAGKCKGKEISLFRAESAKVVSSSDEVNLYPIKECQFFVYRRISLKNLYFWLQIWISVWQEDGKVEF